MNYWREYYSMKHQRKHYGRINIGNLDKIISYMCLNFSSELILMCACCPSGVVAMETEAPL